MQGKLEVLTSAGLNQDEFSPEVTKFEVRRFHYFECLVCIKIFESHALDL